jgi:phosphinothricin acetyltransferase
VTEGRPSAHPAAPVAEAMRDDDWDEVRRVYAEGIATRQATFETQAPAWEAWDRGHRKDCRFVARDPGSSLSRLLGWAALSPVSGRCVYAGVAEVSVYVSEDARGRGVGRVLLAALIQASERQGIWTLQAGIFPENEASVRLHRALGFREVGRRERIGRLDGTWRDVLFLERRSAIAGA